MIVELHKGAKAISSWWKLYLTFEYPWLVMPSRTLSPEKSGAHEGKTKQTTNPQCAVL